MIQYQLIVYENGWEIKYIDNQLPLFSVFTMNGVCYYYKLVEINQMIEYKLIIYHELNLWEICYFNDDGTIIISVYSNGLKWRPFKIRK